MNSTIEKDYPGLLEEIFSLDNGATEPPEAMEFLLAIYIAVKDQGGDVASALMAAYHLGRWFIERRNLQ